MTSKLWEPSAERIAQANITAFARGRRRASTASTSRDYGELWRWSIDHKPRLLARDVGLRRRASARPATRVLVDADKMPGARWFPDARLNFAQNLLERRRADDDGDALVFWGEDKVRRRRVARASCTRSRRASRRRLPRTASAPATASPRTCRTCRRRSSRCSARRARGAIWSSCSPDFGVQGVVDRFGQIEPRVLFTVDGYCYNGKAMPILDKVAEIVARLPSVERVVVVPYLAQHRRRSTSPAVRGAVAWDVWLAPYAGGPIDYAQLPFDHPLYILYSSGHDRRAEVHRARRRRHAAAAPEGTPAARRRQARRPPVLLHDLRLDDVELAGVGPRRGRDAAAVRRLAVRRPRPRCCGSSPTPRR